VTVPLQDPTASLPDEVAPPRKNGELVFEAPWESRAFGMAVALHREGRYSWGEFSTHLAAEVAEHGDRQSGNAVFPTAPGAETMYYAQWLEALETLLVEKGLISDEELDARTAEFAAGLWDEH